MSRCSSKVKPRLSSRSLREEKEMDGDGDHDVVEDVEDEELGEEEQQLE